MTDENAIQKASPSSSTIFVLDTPEGQEHLARMIKHHRRDFLLADLSQQAAMIRFIRQQLAAEHSEAFAATNLQGDPLDEDAIALGIAKVFYLYTDEEEEGESATATRMRGAAAGNSSTSAARDPSADSGDNGASADFYYQNDGGGDAITTFDGEDCQLYECLTNLRQSNNRSSYRITPSPSNSPKFGPKGHSKASSSTTASSNTLPSVAKRKTPVKASRLSDKKRSKKAPAKESEDNDEDMEESLNDKQATNSTTTLMTSEKGLVAAFPTREQLHARAAVILSQTNASPDIPRGVTVRPSGRWQSQVYYKGQSRYLGVFSDSREAALAWTIAKQILTEVQVHGANKMETDKWFITVRDVVTDLVQGAIESAP